MPPWYNCKASDMQYDQITKEVLKAQDGRRVNLTLSGDGPVIGEVIFRYDEATGSLEVGGRIDNNKVTAWLLTEMIANSKKES